MKKRELRAIIQNLRCVVEEGRDFHQQELREFIHHNSWHSIREYGFPPSHQRVVAICSILDVMDIPGNPPGRPKLNDVYSTIISYTGREGLWYTNDERALKYQVEWWRECPT